MSSSPHNSINKTESSFSFYTKTSESENKSAATFTVTPTQMGKRFTTIKMATASPKCSRLNAAASTTPPPHHLSNKQSAMFDPLHTSTPSQRAIQSFSTINTTSMRRKHTSKFVPKLLVPSSAPPALDRPIIVSSAATNFSEWPHSSGYTTPKSCAPFEWSVNCGQRPIRAPINARIVNDNYCQTMTPTRKMMHNDSDVYSLTPRRPMQPNRARLSLLSKFQKYANIPEPMCKWRRMKWESATLCNLRELASLTSFFFWLLLLLHTMDVLHIPSLSKAIIYYSQ